MDVFIRIYPYLMHLSGTYLVPVLGFFKRCRKTYTHLWPHMSMYIPRGSIYTTIMELGPKRPSPLWFWGPNSTIVGYMDPLGL